MNDKTCPACCSDNIKKGIEKDSFTDNFGSSIEFEKIVYTCEDCGSTGDFFNENDDLLGKKIEELNEKTVLNILEYFAKAQVSFASMERVLGLSQRTLTKWKSKATMPSSAGIALLKYLRTYPWLLKVADEKFEFTAAQKILMEAYYESMMTQIRQLNESSYLENVNSRKNTNQISRQFVNTSKSTNIISLKRASSPSESTKSIYMTVEG